MNGTRHEGRIVGVSQDGLCAVVKLTKQVGDKYHAGIDENTDGWNSLVKRLGGTLHTSEEIIDVELKIMERGMLYVTRLAWRGLY
jgi:hypothetical protein